jgi:catalase (peroxidase I)
MSAPSPTPVDYSSSFFKNALKTEIRSKLVDQKANACPMGMRVAWHSAGTFDKKDGSGGTNGATMRFEPEASDAANAGLHIVHDLLLPVKAKFPTVSTADIWAMAGAVAVEVTGGPDVDVKLVRRIPLRVAVWGDESRVRERE